MGRATMEARLCNTPRGRYSDVVEALLAAGADPNHANEEETSPLHSVCSYRVRNSYGVKYRHVEIG